MTIEPTPATGRDFLGQTTAVTAGAPPRKSYFLAINQTTRMSRSALTLGVAAAAALGAAQQSQADTRNWDGDTSTAWATAGNWDTAPLNDLTTDIANFNLATYGGNPVFAPTAPTSAPKINGITIGGSNGAMTITTSGGTNRLQIGASGITMAVGAGAFTLGASTTQGALLGANQTWNNNSSSLVTIGSLGNSNVAAYTLTLSGTGTGGYRFSGAIGNGATAGRTTTVEIDYTSGTVQLRGSSSTFSGGLRIKQGGQVIVGQHDSLGLGTVTMGYGGGSSAVSIMNDASAKSYSAPIFLENSHSGTFTIGGTSGGGTFTGGVTGTHDLLVKAEGGTVSFTTNAVDFTGTLTNQGSGTGAVTIDSDITSNVTNVIQNSANSRLVLGGTASTYANGVKINKGIVQLKTNAAGGAGAISLGEASSGVAATLTGSVDDTSIPNAISLATGAGALQVGSTANVTYTGGITGSNAVELNNSTAGKTLTLSTGAINNAGALTLRPSNATATVRVDSAIGTNVTSVVVNGNIAGGKIILANANTHNGPTTMSGGILELENVNALQNSTLDTGISGPDRTVTFTVAGSNTYNLGGLSGSDDLAIGGNTISVGANNAATTFSGAISGTDGGLTKVGNGALTLSSATNTYTGATQVTGGTLLVNGNISTSITTVQTGATLGGTGTVGAVTVNSGAFHTPGNSPGIQPTGNYSNAGTLGIEINGATVGTDYDQVNTTGTVSLSGLLSITMGYTPVANQLFFILANDDTDAIAGTFSNAAINGNTYTLGGQAFQISYFGNQTSPGVGTFTGGNDVVLMAVIPEPRAALLGGLGMLMLLRRRRP